MLRIFSFFSDALFGNKAPIQAAGDNQPKASCKPKMHTGLANANPNAPSDENTDDLSEAEITCFGQIPHHNTDPDQSNRYPMRESPIPCASINYVLRTQAELIQKIKVAVPLNEDDKDRLLFPIIRNVAGYVHLLPASSNYHHKGRGGLLRHSLEVGLYTVNMGRMHIFDQKADPEAKYRNKGRWFLACFIAGVLHDIGKVLISLTVCGDNGSPIWHPASAPLYDWIKFNNLERYYLSWKSASVDYSQHETAGAILFAQIVPQETRKFLEEANSSVLMNELYDALGGVRRTGALISNLVVKADQLSTSKDLKQQNNASLISHGVDMPVANVLLDIIVSLVEDGTWKINRYQSGCLPSALWETTAGTFIIWESAVNEIMTRLTERNIQGIPRNPTVLAEKLCESGICSFSDIDDAGDRFWKISPLTVAVEDLTANGTRPIPVPEDESAPYSYKFFSALRVQMPTRLYEHTAAPARVLTAVLGRPLDELAAIEWENTLNRKVPDSGPSTEIADSAEEAEADRVAQSQKSYDYFDEYGNPVLSITGLDIEEALNELDLADDQLTPAAPTVPPTVEIPQKKENPGKKSSTLPTDLPVEDNVEQAAGDAPAPSPTNALSADDFMPLQPSRANDSAALQPASDKAFSQEAATANSSEGDLNKQGQPTDAIDTDETEGSHVCAQEFAPHAFRESRSNQSGQPFGKSHSQAAASKPTDFSPKIAESEESKTNKKAVFIEDFAPSSSRIFGEKTEDRRINTEKIAPVQFLSKPDCSVVSEKSNSLSKDLEPCVEKANCKLVTVNDEVSAGCEHSASARDDGVDESSEGKPSSANSSATDAPEAEHEPSKANNSESKQAKPTAQELPDAPLGGHRYRKELERTLKVAGKTFTVRTICERAAKNLISQMNAGGGKLAQHVENRNGKLLCPALSVQMFFEQLQIPFDVFAEGCRVGLYGALTFNRSIQSFELGITDSDKGKDK